MNARGFTLLEMLVALVVMGLVMVGVVQGIRFGVTGWTAQSRHVDRTATLDGVDHVLRLLIEGIDPGAVEQIEGGPNSFTFVGHLPAAFPGPARLALMTIAVTSDRRLVLRWQPYRHAVVLKPYRIVETELLDNTAGVQFQYRAMGQASADWLPSIAGALPALIRVHVTPAKAQADWPDMIVSSFVSPG